MADPSPLYMLDTDTVSYLIKGRSSTIETRLSSLHPSQACISVMTQAELLYGLQRLPGEHRLQALVPQFLRIIRVLPWKSEAAEWYATIRHQLTTTGQPIGELDMMIAAHALSVSAVLVTHNERHHRRIAAPLVIENWV